MTDYMHFRQRLDAVLRTLDVKQVSDFLVAEKQWQAGQRPADPELAMWIMIAGSSTLRDLHERAMQWLETHGHEAEAQVMRVREKKPGQAKRQGKGGAQYGGGKNNDRPRSGGARKKR